MAKIRVKLTEKKIGRLLVLREYTEADGQHMVTCLCDCGDVSEYPRRRVRSGDTRSCGCLKRETAREAVAEYKDKRADGLEKYQVEDTSLVSIGIPKERPGTQTQRKGVNISKGRYVAKITLNKIRYVIGTYDTFEEAEKRRSIGEELLHGRQVCPTTAHHL